MFSPRATQIRAAILALVAVLVGFGILPAGVEAAIQENADKIIGGLAGVWAVLAALTGRAVAAKK